MLLLYNWTGTGTGAMTDIHQHSIVGEVTEGEYHAEYIPRRCRGICVSNKIIPMMLNATVQLSKAFAVGPLARSAVSGFVHDQGLIDALVDVLDHALFFRVSISKIGTSRKYVRSSKQKQTNIRE